MNEPRRQRVPLLLWPFYALWRLLTFILRATGRLVCALTGLAMMAVGVAVSLSIIGAPLGIPLVLLGFLLLVRAMF
jgi:predicted hotdog family 3-hydroxylacyl-ACP dehydratase